MKVGVVVQRYGADISAGSELHARYIAEHLSRHADVRVLTTCARDHLTWRNELPAGEEIVNGIPVERFPVARERHLPEFTRTSSVVFDRMHSWNDELAWLDSEGPVCPALVTRLKGSEFDYVLFFTLRYYTACLGALAARNRAVLVPTAEREPSSGLALLQTALRSARAVMYNSPEERALLQALSGNHAVPGDVVGVGSEIARDIDPERFRARFGIEEPFILYVGRIDENKGCRELFRSFTAFTHTSPTTLRLLLIGTPAMDIPANARITHLGRVTDQEKFDALAAAEALVMPSPYESLSMVLLEAWAVETPVLVNAQCDVLLGQCLRSRGGLYYANAVEFAAALETLVADPGLRERLGANGRRYFERHYAWPVIEQKYMDMFSRLNSEPAGGQSTTAAAGPSWWRRRRRVLPPAAAVVAAAPSGPVVDIAAEATA